MFLMRISMRSRFLALTALAVVLIASLLAVGGVNVGAAGAQVATSSPTASPTVATQQTSYIRVIHAVPDALPIDLYLNGEEAIKGLKFGEATDFVELPSGNYSIDIRSSGAAKTDKPMYSATIGLPGGVSVNIAAVGLLKGKDAQAFKLAVFLTDRSPTAGKARVDVIHLVPDGPALDVLTGGSVAVTQLPYGKSTDKPLNLDPKTFEFALVASGTTSPALIDIKTLNLQADTIYTILAVGQVSDQSIKPLIISTISIELLQRIESGGRLTPTATTVATLAATVGTKPRSVTPTLTRPSLAATLPR
jgi:Domain of unknown function (DUF4397)